MISYILHLKKKGRANKYMATNWYALKSWFASNGVRKIKIDEKIPVGQQVKFLDKIPTKEELKRILGCSSMQTKAMESMMAFGGMRPKDASELTYSRIREDYEAGVSPMAIRYQVSKAGGLWHVTFLTSQGAGYLRDWIEYRKAGGETFGDDTPLFINQKSKEQERIGRRGFEQAITAALRKAGWKRKDKMFKRRPYGLRKYFRSNLLGIDPDFREYLVAHASNSLSATYDGLRDLHKPTIDELRNQFKRAEPSLSTDIVQGSTIEEVRLEMMRTIAKNVFGMDPMRLKLKREVEVKKELTETEEIKLYEEEIEKEKRKRRPGRYKNNPQRVVLSFFKRISSPNPKVP
jgi:hypothetical protein